MLLRNVVILSVVFAAGCSSTGINRPVLVGSRSDDVVTMRDATDTKSKDNKRANKARGLTGVPRGHYPPPGQCRLWYQGRPPGQQPAATKCSALMGRVPAGAFVLYNGKGYDMNHDWKREKKERPNEVPDVIVNLSGGSDSGKAAASKGKSKKN